MKFINIFKKTTATTKTTYEVWWAGTDMVDNNCGKIATFENEVLAKQYCEYLNSTVEDGEYYIEKIIK